MITPLWRGLFNKRQVGAFVIGVIRVAVELKALRRFRPHGPWLRGLCLSQTHAARGAVLNRRCARLPYVMLRFAVSEFAYVR